MNNIISFIRQLFNEPTDFIPLHPPHFGGKEKEYLIDCIDTTFVSSVGEYVDKFEKIVAEYTGAKRAVVCVNGTSALHMAMMLVGVERDDEVITQPLTFIATCNAISYIGAHPVFLDVDPDTMGLSPYAVSEWLKNNTEQRNGECFNKRTNRRVKCCVPMHTFGHPVRIDELVDICKAHNIELVEDAAESLGSFYKGQHTGTFGRVGAISFNGNKTITTGGGGMMLFNDEELADRAKHLTTQAKMPHRWDFVHDEVGYNLRMPNINAALGCAQMEQLDEILKNKRHTAHQYEDFFENFDDIDFVTEPPYCQSNYWFNTIITSSREQRDQILEYTNNHGIMTRPIWELMNRLPMFQHCECGELLNAEELANRVINLPSGVK